MRHEQKRIGSAREAVHANTPDGWYVGRPGYEERYRQWSMYAFDPSEKPVVSKRSPEWTAVDDVGGIRVNAQAPDAGGISA